MPTLHDCLRTDLEYHSRQVQACARLLGIPNWREVDSIIVYAREPLEMAIWGTEVTNKDLEAFFGYPAVKKDDHLIEMNLYEYKNNMLSIRLHVKKGDENESR
jgi:hypothetical protein